MTMVEVTVTYLAMDAPGSLQASGKVPDDLEVCRESGSGAPSVAAGLYRDVGGSHHWHDRSQWSGSDWSALLADASVELWTARRRGQAVGYFELKREPGVAEIRYFGIKPGEIGRGVGGWLLSEAVRRAWQPGVDRVIVNTCTLDHPAALPNYLARGFVVVRREDQRRELPV